MTVKLNGKDYVTVNERVAAALDTDAGYQMVNADTFSIGDRWFYRAVIQVGERHYIGTAEIKFNAPVGSADHKNPIECAETSAIGRALGFAGFGVVEGIASADEVRRNEPQPTKPKPSAQAPAPTQDASNKLAQARTPAHDQTDLARRISEANIGNVGDVKAWVRGVIERDLDVVKLRAGTSDLTMGECSKLLLKLNERANTANGHPDLSELPTGAHA